MHAALKHIVRTGVLLLALLFQFSFASARISVTANGENIDPKALNMRWVFDSSSQHELTSWLSVKNQMRTFDERNISMSYKAGMYWLLIDLDKLPLRDSVFYLEVRNPHINYLGAWLAENESVVKTYDLTGDHFAFSSRNVYHAQFVYKINFKKGKGTQLLLMIDKRNEQLHVPLNFYSDTVFIGQQRTNNLLAGLFVGITIFILLFTLFLYLNIREKLYIYYTLYVLMVGGYVFTDLGFSFMYFYPDLPSIADLVRPFTISQAPIYYILFSRTLLNVKEHFPKIYRFTNWHLVFFVCCFLLGFGIPSSGSLRTFWLLLMQFVMITSIVPVFVFSIAGWRRGIKYSAYIVLASVLFTICSQTYMQYITGNLPDNILTRNAMNIGFAIEIILLTLALSVRFKNYKLEAESLLLQLNRQQENIFKNISEYQEQEMKRLSGLLHDSVGAGLSSIKYNLEAVESQNGNGRSLLRSTIEDVSNLTDEIRNISHTLSPLLLQKKGLTKGLKHLTERYNRTGKIKIWLESIGSMEKASFQNELLVFRIVQELLQNAVKHAAATEIIIQLIIEPELISVLVEDNGRGFDKEKVKEGLGFSQIKALVTFVKGRFEIETQVNKGCSVSIEFPTIAHDQTDKSFISRRSPYVS